MSTSLPVIAINVARGDLFKVSRPRALVTIVGALTLFTGAMNFVSFHIKKPAALALVRIDAGYQLALSFLGILALCICASYSAQEFSLKTLRNLFLHAPSRLGVIFGKVLAGVVIIFALNSYIFLFSLAFGLSNGTELRASQVMGLLRDFSDGFMSTCALGIFGTTLGFICASSVIAIAVGLLWSLIIESILSSTLAHSTAWLPIVNFENLAGSGAKTLSTITFTHSLVVSAGYVVFLLALSILSFTRADIP